MSVKAVIFDMDGVLIDSMPYHVKAWQKAFRPLGVDISAYEVYAREGENWRKSTSDFLKMGGYRPSASLVENIFQKRSYIFKKIFKPKVFRGAKGLLVFLKRKGFMLGLVTATPWREAKKMLPAPMIRQFDIMVCGDDVKRGKPHPEPYIKAIKGLKIRPNEALVIENAPYGIRSCKLAGARCIAVATSLPKRYLTGADVIADSLKEVENNRWIR